MSSEHPVTGLVTRARTGDKQAWDALIERYAPLIWSICRRHGLAGGDAADDVSQNVWLRLVDHLGNLRDPAALPGWLATTARRECGRVLRAARGPLAAGYGLGAETLPDEQAATAEQELLAAERHAALREAFGDLPADCQRLIVLLTADPPLLYAEISARLGIPVGSIGPTRRRSLDKLRRHPAIAALNAEAEAAYGDSGSAPEHKAARAAGGRVSQQRIDLLAPAGSPTSTGSPYDEAICPAMPGISPTRAAGSEPHSGQQQPEGRARQWGSDDHSKPRP